MRGKLFLTGGGGMVGRNIREHPAIADWQVLAPSRNELDLADRDAVYAFIGEHMPDAIIHAAGRVGGIHANMSRPVAFLVENVDVGRNVIMGARHAGVPRLLNLASSCMYPRNHEGLLGEDLILTGELEPTNEGYAIGKILATRLCQYIRREQPELYYKTLIPCNLYGRHDKFDPIHSHLVPAIVHKMHIAKASGSRDVDVWGDGTARREFMYAGDLADAVMRALDEIDAIPELMNIGLVDDYSVQQYYEAAAAAMAWDGQFTHDLSKPVGMRRKKVDISRQMEWGWGPKHSLAEGLAETYRYYLQEFA